VNPESRWRVVSLGIALLSLAAFGFLVYSGLAISPTSCGTVPCTVPSTVRATTNDLRALSDYVYGVMALFIGQIAVAFVYLLRGSPSSRAT
jgi:hypothetical protein